MRNLALILCVLALLCCQRQSAVTTGDKVVWRMAIEEKQGSVQDAYAKRFEQLIEERSGGAIDVIVYPYGTLGTSDQLTEQLHTGTLQFATASPGHLGKLMGEVQVFLLHFVFPEDPKTAQRVLSDPEVLDAFGQIYRTKGFELLSFFSEGRMAWTTNQVIRTPEDFEGVKMRTMTSPLLLAAYEAYGASPTPLPYSEVYSALQLNMIDGQVNPVFAIQEMSFYEVTEVLTFPGHARFITSLMTNRDFYDGLPPDRQKLLLEVVDQLHGEIFEIQRDYNARRLQAIKEAKPELQIVRLTEEERALFREAARPVREQYVDMVGPSGRQVLELIERAIVRAREAQD